MQKLSEVVIGLQLCCPIAEDKFFFVVAELKQADEKRISRSGYLPRRLKLTAEEEILFLVFRHPFAGLNLPHYCIPQIG
jgi:hypothetical protein